MKSLFPLALLAAGAYAVYYFFVRTKRDPLDDHLDEQAALQQMGTIATRGSIAAQEQVPLTRVEPSPMLGAIVSPSTGGGGAPDAEDVPAAWVPLITPMGGIPVPIFTE